MKISDLKVDQDVAIEIIEDLGNDNYIVSIEGRLLRTCCRLNKKPQLGETILCRVRTIKPLSFHQIHYSSLNLDLKV